MDEEAVPPAAAELDIDWVQPGVCADQFENRRLLREAKTRWRVVPPAEDDQPTGLIEVVSAIADAKKSHDRYRDMLVDPKDPWSDYIDPREMPIDVAGLPYWIHARAAKWHEWDTKPRLEGSARSHEPSIPVRCRVIKADGTRCWAWSIDKDEEQRCRGHAPGHALAQNMGHQIALAKVKVMQAMPAMVDELESLALNAASEPVRLKAITEMMDRGGVNSSTDVNVAGSIDVTADPAAMIRSRLDVLADRLRAAGEQPAPVLETTAASSSQPEPEIVDAEIVQEHEETA